MAEMICQESDDRRRDSQAMREMIKGLQVDIADAARQYSKYCILVHGKDMPKKTPPEDSVDVLFNVCRQKWGFSFSEADRQQIKACHCQGDDILLTVNSKIDSSLFHRLMFRDGNWNGIEYPLT